MAAGTWKLYAKAKEALGNATLDLESATLCMGLVTSSYTPGDSHSSYATQIAANEVSATRTSGIQTLTTVDWTITGSSTIKLTAADETVSAADTMKAKYAVIYAQTSSLPLCYVDTNSGVATGVEATIITVGLSTIFQAS